MDSRTEGEAMGRWRPVVLASFALVSGLPAAALDIPFHERFGEAIVPDDSGTAFDSERYDAADLAPLQVDAAAEADRNPSQIPYPREAT
jgi:hypothetical protein